ncbi:MAG: phage holin family protein [Micavibrio sp.]
MVAFTPILKQLLVEGFMNSNRSLPGFNPTGLGIMAFSAVLGVLGFGFLLYAGFLQLQDYYASDIAALIVGGTALVVALLLAWIGKKVFRKQSFMSQGMTQQGDLAKTVTQLLDSLGEELEEPIRDNPKTALMVASLAGFLAGGHARQ